MNPAGTLRIVAVGDVSFNGRYHRLLQRRGPAYPFDFVRQYWRAADLVLGNLESPLTVAPQASPKKFTLRGPLNAVDSLRHAGFDALALANNHAMDFGAEGLAETRACLDAAGLAHLGAGDDEATAQRPLVLSVKGLKIGLIAACDVEQASALYAGPSVPGIAAFRVDECCEAIRALRSEVDWLIVQLHWGQEMQQLPSPTQRAWARQIAEAGADLILGHHPHVLQPFEMIGRVPVFYSLGNFLFSDMFWQGKKDGGEPFVSRFRIHPLSRRTGWAEVVLRKDGPPEARLRPARQHRDLAVRPEPTRARLNEWHALCQLLDRSDYSSKYALEACCGEDRLRWASRWRPLSRRLELKMFELGLIGGTARAF